MAELVKIKVVVSGGAQAAGELEKIKKLSDQLRQPITVKIDTSGLKAVDKDTLKTAKAFSDLAKQIYKLEVQHTKQAKEAEKTAQVEAKAAGEVAKAYAKVAQEEAKAATQREKNAGITERQVLEDKRLATQQERTATAQANLTREQVKGENQMQRMEGATDRLNIALGNLAAFAIHRVASELRRAVGEALNTMREVDSELVTIRKVTGFSGEQIDRIREQAYSTASAYGVGASDYLASVAAFSRAGYKEQSAALAELSTKTQIVGDTTAETANQFLLSVDAAYKYKGSIDELTRVLDGANEIDNKYATSIEKIAEGMGIVAPVAAQVHVGVDELAAALGTITAVTQRSGSEAARAMRAIMLNIVGDTKTEIEDGVTWTSGEIESLRDVIRQYAPEAYKAAEATGSIINPMEAIAGLSKSMKDNLLSEADLMAMVSDIGGKLRSSQLLALIQNWDMYQSMLVDYGNALGSADKEVQNALDSWERKTAILKNTWAEFVSGLVETDTVKDALDALTKFIAALDDEGTKAEITIVALGAAIMVLPKAFALLQAVPVVQFVASYTSALIGMASGSTAAASAVTFLNATLLASPIFWGVAAVAAGLAVVKIVDALTVSTKELSESMRDHAAEARNAQSEIDALTAKLAENNALIEQSNEVGASTAYRERLQVENERIQQQIELLKERKREELRDAANDAVQLANKKYYNNVAVVTDGSNTLSYESYDTPIDQYLAQLYAEKENPISDKHAKKSREEFNELIDAILEARDALVAYEEAGAELSNEQKSALDLYDNLIEKYVGLARAKTADVAATEAAADATEDASNSANSAAANANKLAAELRTSVGVYNDVSGKLGAVAAALQELDEEGVVSFDTMGKLIEQYPDLAEAAELTASGYVIERSALEDLIVAKRAEHELTYNNAMSAAREQISALDGEARAWNMTTTEIKEYLRTKAAALRAQAAEVGTYKGSRSESLVETAFRRGMGENLANSTNAMAAAYENALNEILANENALSNFDTAFEALRNSLGTGGGSRTGGGSSTAKAERDSQLDYLKEVVALREGELSLMQARGDSEDAQIAKMRDIQAALHEQANYLRSIGASQTDINALSTKWWQIENNILSIQDKMAKQLREEIADSLKDAVGLIEKARDDALKPLNEELDKLKAAKDAVSDRREEEEKLLAVEKARIALENAQNERNVRQYNASSGQWEWVANAQTVQDAAQTLADASADLAQYYADKEYKAAVDALERQVDYTKKAFDEFKSAWEEAAQAVRDGKMSFEDAYAYIEQKMREIYNDYGIDLTGLLNTINGEYDGIAQEASKIYTLLRMQANSIAWHMTDDENVRRALHEENTRLGESLGMTFDSASGSWLDSSGQAAYTLANNGGVWTSSLSSNLANLSVGGGTRVGTEFVAEGTDEAIAQIKALGQQWWQYHNAGADFAANAVAAQAATIGADRGWIRGDDGNWYWDAAKTQRVFDTGGILYGKGAIKATDSAEMVLPPAMTQSLLEAEKTGAFNELLNHLGIVTAAANSYAGVGGGTMRDNIGSQHNGNVYNIGGVQLSEQQARGMTIYDLAQMSRTLATANA